MPEKQKKYKKSKKYTAGILAISATGAAAGVSVKPLSKKIANLKLRSIKIGQLGEKIRLKSIGKGALIVGAGAAAIYGVNKLVKSTKKGIKLSKQEIGKRISVGLKKSSKFKNRKIKRR